MNVGDLLTRLSIGEFSNLSLSGEGSGEISENKQAAVIGYANEGLLDLHSRFVLSEKSVIIQMISGHVNYYLLSRFAQSTASNGSRDPRYIMDRAEPYEDDAIKILSVNNELGQELPLNDRSNRFSLYTPKFNQLQIPHPQGGEAIEVAYQAKHRTLEPGVMEAPIFLADVLHEPLRYYIAAQIYSNMNGADNSAKGQEYMAKYEAKCGLAVDRDLLNNTPDNSNEAFERNGWI